MADYGLFHSIRPLWTILCIFLFIPVNGLAIKRRTPGRVVLDQPDITVNGKSYTATGTLDRQIVDFLTKHRYSGCTVGVAKQDGTLLYTQGYGKTQDGARLQSSSLLPASSISKLLTAIGLLKLVEEGRLTLSDFVFGNGALLGHLTPFPSNKAADQRLFDIRVIHLLHHTSGLRGYVTDLNDVKLMRGHKVQNITDEMHLGKPLTIRDVIRYSCGQPLVSDPGREFAYSNLGYDILGEIIAQRSGVAYEEFITRAVLEPLGMWKTTTLSGAAGNMVDGGPVDISTSSIYRSSLGWHSTVHDLIRLMNGIQGQEGGKILSPGSLQALMAPPASPVSEHRDQWYGIGVHVGNDGSWWQVGDHHTNEVLLYQSGNRNIDSSGERQKWVVLLPENRHRNLRNDFVKIFGTVVDWPSSHDPIRDCADAYFDKCGDHYLLNTRVPVSHFRAFITSMSQANFTPTWIDVHQGVDGPLVSSIWHNSNASSSENNIVEVNLTSDALRKRADELLSQRIHLQFIAPYFDGRHDKFIAVFGDTASGFQKIGWETTEDIYDKSSKFFTEELSLVPTVKAIHSEGERKIVSFIFDRTNTTSWKIFDEVPVENVRSLTLAMAKEGRTMVYAKSYDFLDEVYFSTIFANVHKSGMQLDFEIDQGSLIERSRIMQGKNFRPQLITGYSEGNGTTKFLILWTRMGVTP